MANAGRGRGRAELPLAATSTSLTPGRFMSPPRGAGPAAERTSPQQFTLRRAAEPGPNRPALLRRRGLKIDTRPQAFDWYSEIAKYAGRVKIPDEVIKRWKENNMDDRLDKFCERYGGRENSAKLAFKYLAGGLIGQDILRFLVSTNKDVLQKWGKLIIDGHQPRSFIAPVDPTVVYDMNGRVIATLCGEQVRMEQIADPLWQAVVSSEDRRFFSHLGVDLFGFFRAVSTFGLSGGGSTITQQLVKNMLLSQERTITRKVVEMMMSLVLERQISKPALLEAYLNNVYWGHGVWGAAAAASTYFRKRPSELVVGEAALLAALLPAPEYRSPYKNPEVCLKARGEVLRRMAANGYISEDTAAREANAPLPWTLSVMPTMPRRDGDAYVPQKRATPFRAPWFVQEVLFDLLGRSGIDARRRGGLKIYTTLDLGLQERAEQLVFEDGLEVRNGVGKGEAALVAMDVNTGGVRVMCGGRDYAANSFNRATMARRQPGSTFKPVVYLAALETGLVTPGSLLEDVPVVFDLGGGSTYRPQNYTKRFKGTVTLTTALAESLNVPTVKLADMVGVNRVATMAERIGITSPLQPSLAMALGACEVSPLELTSAYNTLAARGTWSQPHLVTAVRDYAGRLLFHHNPVRKQVVSPSACNDLHRMLRAAVTRGTGRAAMAGWSSPAAAGKTGTSDSFRDAWFAGYANSLTTVVWVGNDNNMPLPGGGSVLAAPLWARFMRSAQTKNDVMGRWWGGFGATDKPLSVDEYANADEMD